MNVGILGSRMAAQAPGAKLAESGRQVMLSTLIFQFKVVR
jgi:hypothetical protein